MARSLRYLSAVWKTKTLAVPAVVVTKWRGLSHRHIWLRREVHPQVQPAVVEVNVVRHHLAPQVKDATGIKKGRIYARTD